MNDHDIVALYWSRSEDAIAQSERRYGSYCYTVAYNILQSREDAQECVNDTWLRAWESIPPARPERLSTYLGELLAVYGIDEAADIAAIDIDGRRVTDRAAIEGIYETLTTARALGAQDFDREVFGTCKSEEEVSARNEAMADSMLPLRLTTTEGLVTGSLHYYPDIGYCYWALGYFCLDQALVW